MKNVLLLAHLFSLIIGGLIYVLFRDSSLIFFGWIDQLGGRSLIQNIQVSTLPLGKSFPNWVIYSLPDGLWLFSYVCLMLYLWRRSLTRIGLIWVFLLPFLAICHELAQLTNLIIGTFDPMDLIFYCLATVLPFVFFKKTFNLVKTTKQP